MIKMALLFITFSITFTAKAYVPTVESLFRNGSNADVTANGVSLTLKVKKAQLSGEKPEGILQDVSLVKGSRAVDFYKVFFTKTPTDVLKVAQARYESGNFSQASLEHKVYFPNFTSFSFQPSIEGLEKGLFFGVLNSLVLNDGSFLIDYLKSLGVQVRLNSELINREKIEYLAAYKKYLVTINKDRNARKTEVNPLRPEDPLAREKVDEVMEESMYIDTRQVKLARDDGDMSWVVKAGNFEAVLAYKNRQIQKVLYKSQAGEFEILCKDYWLANGTHLMPKYIIVKTLSGDTYQVEVTNLRHYAEKDDEMVKRLRGWDEILKGKESLDPRPPFLL